MLELGGNIQLSGFSNLDQSKMIVIKKMVGNHVKRLDTSKIKVLLLKLTLKTVHSDKQFEIHGHLETNGKVYKSEAIDHNIFFSLNKVLNGLEPKQS